MEDGSRPAPGSGEQAGELERLIAAEARLDARVQQAAAEARSLVTSARARVEEVARQSQEELKQAIAKLEGEMEQERARQLRAVAEDLDRDLVFLQAVTADRISELAAHALDRLLQLPTPDQRP